MTKRALFAVAGFLGLCLSLSAQPTGRANVFSALNNSSLRLPSLTLSDGAFFSFASAFNRMETTTPDFLPALSMANTTPRSQKTTASAAYREDSSKEIVEVQRANLFDYAHGEVGFLYGVSSGKYGGSFEQGYVLGEVGNEHFQISAGASYEHSNERFPRFGR
jgi:hypothetical protein